ncbi:MAG: outer membrane beta-barrel protein [Muribaculaceae bacterium]|nr:outer membrane beta-barrel protein [Muribaculaceae bacterium]
MKKLIAIALLLIPLARANAVKCEIGVSAGITSSSLSYTIDSPSIDYSGYEGSSYVSFTGSVDVDLTFWKGLGLKTGAGFQKLGGRNNWGEVLERTDMSTIYSSYISIPICPKYTLDIPVIGKIVRPTIYTGVVTNISIQTTNSALLDESAVTLDWRVGLGLRFLDRYDVQASYNIPLVNAFSFDVRKDTVKFKIPYWAVTVGVYF